MPIFDDAARERSFLSREGKQYSTVAKTSPEKSQSIRPLRVFLCHSSRDKSAVRKLYESLCADGVNAWLDEEDLVPGQDWALEISEAVRSSDVVIVCLSCSSTTKAGYVQKEIKFALDIADEQPEGAIFLIPLRLEDCDVPIRLRRWHWVDLFLERGYQRLMRALKMRTDQCRPGAALLVSEGDQTVPGENPPHKADHRREHRAEHRADHRLLRS